MLVLDWVDPAALVLTLESVSAVLVALVLMLGLALEVLVLMLESVSVDLAALAPMSELAPDSETEASVSVPTSTQALAV